MTNTGTTRIGQLLTSILALRAPIAAAALALATVAAGLSVAQAAQAQMTEKILHGFGGAGDGAHPDPTALIRDSAGNLYGTTVYGGPSNYGSVFKITKAGKETVLYSFTNGADGSHPRGTLSRDPAGNLYGTATFGGSTACNLGCGTAFKLGANGKLTVLHSFTGGADGANPYGGLTRDAAGNLYGTTANGGVPGQGVVFRMDRTGSETVLYSFSGKPGDGSGPYSGLTRDSAGNLYGTTFFGGNDSGIVFRVDSSGHETILHSFLGGAAGDGAYSTAGVVRDRSGNLYGTTTSGGSFCNYSCGVVFKLDASGAETVLHDFTGGADGANPNDTLIRDAAGNLYGTTPNGGSSNCTGGCGVVFKMNPAGKEKVLHTFVETDGREPVSGLVRDSVGNLYGTTYGIGAGHYALGTVFELEFP
jgi:uncharacterized repeat protein (TIGR03803 family)